MTEDRSGEETEAGAFSQARSTSAEGASAQPVMRDRSRRNLRRATLADVARLAGVSLTTASRALNGTGELLPSTRASVVNAAAALDFRPSSLARSLRFRRTFTIGFIVPDLSS